MKRLPGIPLDPADRRILAIGIILVLVFILVCIVIGGGLGAGVLAFRLVSGGV